MGLRRGQREATLGCLGRGRGAACGSAKGAEWGLRWGCAGNAWKCARAQRGAAQGRSVGPPRCAAWGGARGAAWGGAGAQRGAAQGRRVGLRMGAGWGCAWAQGGAAHGRRVGLHMGAAWGRAGAQGGAAHRHRVGLRTGATWGCAGGSVKLRWAASAAEGAQRVAQQRALNGAALGLRGKCVEMRRGAAWGGARGAA